MKKLIVLVILTFLLIGIFSSLYAQEATTQEELVRINVRNEFDEEVQVQLDKGRKYFIGAKEKITLGERKPGKYTLTIYNKKGEFVDNLTRNIGKDDKESYKYNLNEKTVSNSNKITGLSTGQKIAITTGALGAAALGTALINMALQNNEAPEYIPPQEQTVYNPPPVEIIEQQADINNAFAPGGKAFKFLNAKYPEVTLIVLGTDGNPIGNNWVIPKSNLLQKPQPLIFNGEKITVNPDQKVKAVLPNGTELQRNAFELDLDPLDGSYVWVLK